MPRSPESQLPSAEKEKPEIRISKRTLVFLVGLPGSGKSTFAERHFPAEAIISTDRIRGEVSNNPANQLASSLAFLLARRFAEERLKNGDIAVIDAQNLQENNRANFYELAEKYGARVEAIFLNVSPELSVARDKERSKKGKRFAGEKYIRSRRGIFATAKKSLEVSPHIQAIHVVEPEEAETISVVLPEGDAESLAADQELQNAGRTAEKEITEATTEKREAREEKVIPVPAGAVLFVESENMKEGGEFLKSNFVEYQVIDDRAIARRLHTKPDDEAVLDVMKIILRHRLYLNLTTAISLSEKSPFKNALDEAVKEAEAKRGIKIPTPVFSETEVSGARVEITREAPEDAPLFLIGDIHGCRKAMGELSGRIREENLAAKKGEDKKPARQIVFVGDMSDRGPYDAEAVIYITALVRRGRAMLVKGNHDANLLRGLKGEDVKSEETRKTIAALQQKLKPASMQKIIEVLEQAPYYAEWKKLVVVHASLPRIPRREELLTETDKRTMTHGVRSGTFTAGRADSEKLRNVVAHDPDVLIVGGHTHEEEPVVDLISGTTVLDGDSPVRGKLWGMYYPELELASANEPSVVKMYELLRSETLPRGEQLLAFIEYAREQGFIETKRGTGEYEGLIITTYSGITEVENLWDAYPALRHFRGLIIDIHGNIIARPFKKTHKAGDEIPLEKLNIQPEKILEKANGSMGIVYFWNEKWRVATKFSFENEEYTKPAKEMLADLNTGALDRARTYVFEIILPDDAHIVDYEGNKELILLNSINAESGRVDRWEIVEATAKSLGVRTAKDMTGDFQSGPDGRPMTISDIYALAQQSGQFQNLEGLMAVYTDQNGEAVFVKIKTREYNDKKFVRDHLDWEDIIKAVDMSTMDIPPDKRQALLSYNFDNDFANAALAARIQWIQEQYRAIADEARQFLFAPQSEAEKVYNAEIAAGTEKKKAVGRALQAAIPHLERVIKAAGKDPTKGEMNAFMGFLRSIINGEEKPEAVLAKYALERVRNKIGAETQKRGKNSFWVVPEN